VLLADDQALVRAGFRLILDAEPDFEVVGEAADGEEAAALSRDLAPDVALMDIRMPGLNGIEATRRLLADHAELRVLMLTTFDLDEYVVDAVRTIHDGDSLLAPASIRRLLEQHARPTRPAPALERLTAREREVLELLARGHSNAEIAAELVVEPSTVKSHVASLLSKLDLRDRVHAVVYAYESGLVRAGAR
jgi:DNA-binding NarL/FixJ family response regulator